MNMKYFILLVFGSLFCLAMFRYKSKGVAYETENHVVVRQRRDSSNELSYEKCSEQTLPLKKLRKFSNGKNDRSFEVDRNDLDSLRKFLSKSGEFIKKLTLKNFDTLDRITDVWHHRLVKGAKLDMRNNFFNFSNEKPNPKLVFENCYDGWFPLKNFKIDGELIGEAIYVEHTSFNCEIVDRSLPKVFGFVDRFGSLAVRINHNCPWRYWNFDVANINVDNFAFKKRYDLNYTSAVQVISLKLKGFGSNMTLLDKVIKLYRLDWIRDVGINGLEYMQGCLVIEDTDPHAVFRLKELRQLHYDRENFNRSAPFIINASRTSCLTSEEKIKLYEHFGIVALHIIDSCPLQKKVVILDGRQPFDYVTNRNDVRFSPGDSILYARIRHFTDEDHLKNLEEWFHKMGYHNVTEIGEIGSAPDVPEVAVIGCISTFNPFPYAEKAIRSYGSDPDSRFTLPIFYFRNNSGLDCLNRRVIHNLRRKIGKFTAASSRDCECGHFTSADFFWRNCLAHRGTLEITGSPKEEDIARFKNIRHIHDGQLWIHDTRTVSNLKSFNKLGRVQCEAEKGKKPQRKLAAVRIGGYNSKLETIDLPNLSKTENCNRLLSVSGDKISLPVFSESQWMKKNSASTLLNILREKKKCIAYSGKGGGMSAEFAHQLDRCVTIEGDLVVDGNGDNISKIEVSIRNIRRVTGNVIVRNINKRHCRLLEHLKYIDGNFTYDNNPSLERISLSLIKVNGHISFTRVPRFCLEFYRIYSIVEAFKTKQITLDCSLQTEIMFVDFEERYGNLQIFSDFGICLTVLVFVCYMMTSVLVSNIKALDFPRWREMTELDIRLKIDYTADLDEDSSDEEPDVMTWKRKTLVKNRLDGRDLEGERILKEKKEYKENKKKVRFSQKVGALARTLKRKESDSEFSGQSWLKRKQRRNRKRELMRRDEDTPFPVLIQTDGSKWIGRTKDIKDIHNEVINEEIAFIEQLNDTVRDVVEAVEAEHKDRIMSILEMLEKKKLMGKKEIVSEYQKLEEMFGLLEDIVVKGDKTKWDKWAKMRRKLRLKAVTTFGYGDPVKHLVIPVDPKEDSLRMNAGYQPEKRRCDNGMFTKLIVETMHWRPPDEETGKRERKKVELEAA